jgi:sugar (pentulose or hexulose) kinase
MFADAIGSSLTLAAEPEASSRGAALLAMGAAGIIPYTAHAAARMGKTIEPDMKAHAIYGEILEKQQKLYEAIRYLKGLGETMRR